MKQSRKGIQMLIAMMVLLAGSALLFAAFSPRLGAAVRGEGLARLRQSENFREDRFRNTVATNLGFSEGDTFGATVDFLRGNPDRTPGNRLPTIPVAPDSFTGKDGLGVTWLGHSTCLIELDGRLILTDPMFSDRASPLPFLGPKRFRSELLIEIEDLPKLDAVLISHDHYDHLDYKSIVALRGKTDRFYVPLGVGGHLEKWGVPEGKIIELDWWEESTEGPLTFAAAPARHFSGRGFTDRNRTLWASWVIMGSQSRVFFGGDSGYFEGFRAIGEKFGPFDITMLESGAYNKAWAEIHMMPEETVQAHLDLRGKVLLPIHWGKFNLALHPWTEPIERLLAAAEEKKAIVAAPVQGQKIQPSHPPGVVRWWDNGAEDKYGRSKASVAGQGIQGDATAKNN